MKTEESWKDNLDKFSLEQRSLIEGGVLSKRFSSLPLTLSHPVFISSFYGFLLSIILLLPFAYGSNWDYNIWISGWLLYSLLLLLLLSVLGGISSLMIKVTKRFPISVPRKFNYLSPFLGLILLTSSIGFNNSPSWLDNLGLFLMIFPGPVYVHLSWAPRWRLLDLLDQGINPFEGTTDKLFTDDDFEINEIIESFSEE